MKKINLLLTALCFVSFFNKSFGQVPLVSIGDITFSFQLNNESVNNLNCETLGDGSYVITVANSWALDTAIIVYNGYSQMDTIVNTIGNSNFDVGATWINGGALLSTVIAYSGNYMFPHFLNKIIAHGETLVVNNIEATIPATSSGCTFSSVGGNFFIDNNGDCTYNTGDAGIMSNVHYTANYANGQLTNNIATNSSGLFNDALFKSDGFINAVFTIPTIYNFAYTISACSQMMYNITTLPAANINFSRECAADVDVRACVTGFWPGARPLIPFNLFPNVSNVGCQAVSGVLELILDPNVTYDALSSSNPADSISGNSLFWHYTNLTNVGISNTGYWNQFWGGVNLTPTAAVNIGDYLHFTVNAQIPTNDTIPSNNSYSIAIPVVNSYDPNVKYVEPAGTGVEGYIPATTQKLTYTVQFQNTGTADALEINILDTLQANVIPTSLKIVDASHQMTPTWLSNSVVKFNFHQIHLPDSTSDEANSHGFVTFEIDMVQGLAPGTQINNLAYIYFDSNPAVVTDTARNTIERPSTASIMEYKQNGLGVLVYPNPMTESTTFSIQDKFAKDVTLRIFDMTGKVVNTIDNQGASKIIVNKNQLENGIYIFEIRDNATQLTTTGRLVVQ